METMVRIRHYKQFTNGFGLTIAYKPIPKAPENSTPYFELQSGISFRKISQDYFSRREGRINALEKLNDQPVPIKSYPGEDLKDSIFRYLKNQAYQHNLMTKGVHIKPQPGDIPPKLLIEISKLCQKNKNK